jgi:hypothetical protein
MKRENNSIRLLVTNNGEGILKPFARIDRFFGHTTVSLASRNPEKLSMQASFRQKGG